MSRRIPQHHKATRRQTVPTPAEVNALIALHQAGQWAHLEAEARKMVAHHPANPLGWTSLGHALQGLGRLPEAVAALTHAVRLAPQDAGTHGNLGNTLKAFGRYAEAEASYRKALAIQPDLASAHNNLGNIFQILGRPTDAAASYRQALLIRPDYANAHNNLGNVLKNLGHFAEAEASLRRALALQPEYANAHSNLGNTLAEIGRLNEAEACYRRALALQPDFVEAHSNLLFNLNYQAKPHDLCFSEAQEYGRLASAKVRARFSSWLCVEQPERLRVGVVSGDLWRHPVGYFLESVIAGIDTGRVELFSYPTVLKNDDLTERLRRHFAGWRPIAHLDDETAARQIHADGVHVLIDLSGHTAHNRLPVFAWKPAPVQVSWLGYFATTGVAEMDWFLADETGVPPEHRQHFTEKVWYLPETRLCFTPPVTEEPVAPLPARQRGYVCFGSFQKLAKINDEVLRVWSRVLASCLGSRLRVQEKALSDPDVTQALRKRMEAQGIAPERVDLHGAMPRREYLVAHAEVDILLDTFPFPGGTTTCEALWMGVPTLTLAGETLIARQGASLLTAAGLPDWIAADDDEYVAKAVAFVSDLEALAGLRVGLREQVLASPLFDAPRFARNLEDALWGMWRQAGRSNKASCLT